MKIVLFNGVLHQCPPQGYGSEARIWDLARELGKAGHEVTLIAPRGSATPPGGRLIEIPLAPIGSTGWGHLERMISIAAVRFPAVREADVVHDMSCGAYMHEAVCMAYGCKKAHLYTQNGISWAAPKLARHNIVVVSEKARELGLKAASCWEGTAKDDPKLLIRDPPLPSARVVRYGADPEFYSYGAATVTLHPSYNPHCILYVGRPHEHKGIEFILWLARIMLDDLFICAWRAESPDHKLFAESFARDAAALPNVEIVELPADERHHSIKRDLMASAAVALHPATYHDACPSTVVEAMLCGVPVAAFRRGGVPEIVTHEETGYLVDLPPAWPNCDLDAVTVALSQAIHTARGLSRAWIREKAKATCSAERMTRGYVALYEELLQGGRW